MAGRTLAEMRRAIAGIDEQLLELLGKRMELIHAIGRHKVEHGLPIPHPRDDARVLEYALGRAEELRIPKRLAERIWAMILAESRAIQERKAQRQQRVRKQTGSARV